MAKDQKNWTIRELRELRIILKSGARNKLRFAADYLDRSYSSVKQFALRERKKGNL